MVSSTPILRMPDFSKEFVIDCDASRRGVGAVLARLVKTGWAHRGGRVGLGKSQLVWRQVKQAEPAQAAGHDPPGPRIFFFFNFFLKLYF